MTTQHTAAAGDLDLDFGDQGRVHLVGPNSYKIRVKDVRTGPGQKIYFAAETGINFHSYALGRLNTDGSSDLSFGDNGLTSGRLAFQNSTVHSFAFTPDSQLMLLGTATSVANQAPALARFTENGTLDTRFGTDGYVRLDRLGNTEASAPAAQASSSVLGDASSGGLEVLPDGKILGFAGFNTRDAGVIFRLHPDGSLDNSFNGDGYVRVVNPGNGGTVLNNIMVQADGKCLGCGEASVGGRSAGMFVRYGVDGRLDPSFGQNGWVRIYLPVGAIFLRFQAMARQPNQRILGIGYGSIEETQGALVSLEPDGSPSIQFNGGNPLLSAPDDADNTVWYSGAIQRDGKILVTGGSAVVSFDADVVVARLIDGAFDPSFNGKGWVRTAAEQGNKLVASSLAVQVDGKILVAANNNFYDGLILRYHG